MPLIVLLAGVVLIAAGFNNRLSELLALIREDFAPSDGAVPFGTWLLALLSLGSLGYIKEVRPLANGFLVLIFVAIFLSNRGFYARLMQAFTPASLTSAGTSTAEGPAGGTASEGFNAGAGNGTGLGLGEVFGSAVANSSGAITGLDFGQQMGELFGSGF